MLPIGSCFLFLFFVSFIWGNGSLKLLEKAGIPLLERRKQIMAHLSGIMLLTVAAQIISLFTALNYKAAVSIFVMTIILAVVFHKLYLETIKECVKALKIPTAFLMLFMLFLVIAVTSLYPSQYDNYLYQAQAVRWLEEYKCVKGTANVAARLGFNNSIFALMALTSFKNLWSQFSLHCVNAYLCAMGGCFAIYYLCNDMTKLSFTSEKKEISVEKALWLVVIFYVFYNMSLISSVGTDIPALLYTLLILCLFASFMEAEEKNPEVYALLCVFIIFTLTIKLSMVMLCILIVPVAFTMISKRKWKEIGIFVGLGILVLAPFLIRNYFISGWLLFPFEKLDLFNVTWKVPYEIVAHNAVRVYGWARIPGVSTEATMQLSLKEWWPVWWSNQTRVFQLFYKVDFLIIVVEFFFSIYDFAAKRKENRNWILLELTVAAGFLYWAFTAPDVRFGWCFLISIPFLGMAVFLKRIGKYPAFVLFTGSLLLVFAAFFGNRSQDFVRASLAGRANHKEFYLYQGDYAQMPIQPKETNGITFYFPTSDSCTGYYGFPGTQYEGDIDALGFLGERLEDGIFYKGVLP